MKAEKRNPLRIVVAVTSLLFALACQAQTDIQAEIERCDACHGPQGASGEDDMPGIGGISALVIEEYLFEFADDARPCRESDYRYGDTSRAATDMCAIAKELSEEQVTALADYYAGQPFVAAKQEFDAAKAARGASIHRRDCEKCHSDGGSYQDDDAGRLAGQWMPYLKLVFDDYRAGKRPIWEDTMEEKVGALDDESIDALIHYYASLQ